MIIYVCVCMFFTLSLILLICVSPIQRETESGAIVQGETVTPEIGSLNPASPHNQMHMYVTAANKRQDL